MNKFIISLCFTALLVSSASRAMDSKSRKLGSKLLAAAARGSRLAVRMLLARGAPVNAKGVFVRTPLFYAARNGDEAMCRRLIEKNATIDAKDEHGHSPLIEAVSGGYEAVCRLLIEKNACIQAKNICGWTPLVFAACHGHEAVCRLLIKKNAILEEVNKYGETPLMMAVANGHGAAGKLLIAAQLWRSKAPIITFLGIVRKRKKNLPCEIQYDVAKMIARMVFDREAVRKEMQNIKVQIDIARIRKENMHKGRP